MQKQAAGHIWPEGRAEFATPGTGDSGVASKGLRETGRGQLSVLDSSLWPQWDLRAQV